MKRLADYGYNERLFGGGFRAWLQYARFRWLARSLAKLQCRPKRVLELGCFDAKTLLFLPEKPARYVGLDANWEGGLDLARRTWKDEANFAFLFCREPRDIRLDESFDVAICMETLEHVAPHLVDAYLAKISEHTDGYFFVTVPNEKGIVFALKHLAKRIGGGDHYPYTLSEYVNATLGRMHRVARYDHKGFDYNTIVQSMQKYFRIMEVSGYPFPALHHSIGFGVGVIASKCV